MLLKLSVVRSQGQIWGPVNVQCSVIGCHCAFSQSTFYLAGKFAGAT